MATAAPAPPRAARSAEAPLDPTRAHAPALDGLRAVAALFVITLHVGIYSGQVASSWLGIGEGGTLGPFISRLTVGVPIFFVLSGLLLFRPWAEAALDRRPGPSTVVYLWHRALRILPAYWLAAITALLLFGTAAATGFWPVVRTLGLLHIYEENAIPLGITQTWSLATEVAFYALLPLIALGLRRVLVRAGGAWLAFAALEAVSLVAIVLTHRAAAGPYPLAHLWLPEYLGLFGAGIALAIASARLARRPERPAVVEAVTRRPWLAWLVAAAAYALMSTSLTGTTAAYPTIAQALLEHALSLVVAVGLVLPLVLAPGRGPSGVLSRRPAHALGRISYGLFLWHMVVVEGWLELTGGTAGTERIEVLWPIAVAGSIVLATASFVLVERPLRRFRPLAARLRGKAEALPPVDAPVVVEVRA